MTVELDIMGNDIYYGSKQVGQLNPTLTASDRRRVIELVHNEYGYIPDDLADTWLDLLNDIKKQLKQIAGKRKRVTIADIERIIEEAKDNFLME